MIPDPAPAPPAPAPDRRAVAQYIAALAAELAHMAADANLPICAKALECAALAAREAPAAN